MRVSLAYLNIPLLFTNKVSLPRDFVLGTDFHVVPKDEAAVTSGFS